MNIRASFISLFMILFLSVDLYSQWSTDPAVNNVVSVFTGEQSDPSVTSDGSGGAIIAWYDDRNGNNDIYAQRINSSGAVMWTAGGIPICTQTSAQSFPSITGDGSGGAVITWIDSRTDDGDVYAQRVDANGSVLWTVNGLPVCTDAGAQYKTAITSDGSGGAIIAWYDFRNHIDDNIFVQRIDQNGSALWTADGIVICSAANNQRYPSITSDGGTGAVITWQDERTGSGDPNIYAQKVNSSGTAQWTADGLPVCTQANYQQEPKITFDGSSGAIIAWQDNRNGNSDIYAQRIDAGGSVLWTGTPNGAPVCTLAGTQVNPTITNEGSGGAILAWTDSRNIGTTSSDIYAQKIDANGTAQWGTDIEISRNSAQQNYPAIANTGSGSAVVSWYDYRNSDNDIYATKVFSDGTLPVELTMFAVGHVSAHSVELRWTTASETNNYGFDIEQTAVKAGSAELLWSKAGFVNGNGTSNVPNEYSFTHWASASGTFLYRLKQIDRDGRYTYLPEVEVTIGSVLSRFSMEQNFPNPFNPATTIQYTVGVNADPSSPNSAHVRLIVYDILGKEIASLVNEYQVPGNYAVRFNAASLPSGLYFYRISAGGVSESKRMILLK